MCFYSYYFVINFSTKAHTTNFPIFRGMASTLRMRTAISPGQWQPWTAVSSSLDSSAWHGPKKEVSLAIIDPVIYYQGECKSTPLIKRNSCPWLRLPWWYGWVHSCTSVLKLVIFSPLFFQKNAGQPMNFIFNSKMDKNINKMNYLRRVAEVQP